jgi:Kdo2-lipid IVA lauroyltransferase/acyltransferase
MKKQIEYLIFLLFRSVILMLPLKSAQNFGKTIGQVAFRVLTKRREITIENLKYAFPDKSDTDIIKIVRGVFQNLGISICEFLWFPNLNEDILSRLVKFTNLEMMIERCKLGKGVIVLSGHFSNWELIALGGAYAARTPFTIIVKTQSNRKVDEVVNRHRTKFGNIVVPMEQSIREILSTLKKGGVVAMVADQSAPKESIFVEFFGRTVATFQGPAMFALRTGAPLLMGVLVRQPDYSYELIVEEIDHSDLAGYNEENVKELTRRHVAVLEKYIRLHPDQWMWTHRRWKNVLKI